MNTGRMYRIIIIAVLIAFSGVIKAEKGPGKPNLLLIITDEHNFRTLGCYRDQLSETQAFMWGPDAVVETPHIDFLAEHGTLFNSMYASAPVCTPSRASMFTGMYPHTLGMPNNSSRPGDGKYLRAGVTTIADVMSEAGYVTGYSGKWHLAENTNKEEFWAPYPVGHPGYNYGFQDNKYMFNGGHDKYKGIDEGGVPYRADKNPALIGKDEYGQSLYRDERSERVKFTTDWLADRCIEFIDEHTNEAFFYVVSIPDPHTPNAVHAPYNTMYDDLEINLPHTFDGGAAYKSENDPEWRRPSKTEDREELIADIRQYFGMVKCIDDNVGRILKKLEEKEILENTLVVFSADHGDLLGEHARVNKGTIHEASAKIPFVIAHGSKNNSPLVPRGRVVNEAANTTDWMPTFLGLLDIPCPEVAGRNLEPLLAEEGPGDWKDVTFVRKFWMAAVSDRYKLQVDGRSEPWLLDIQADPDEYRNFINDPAYADVAKELALELKNYMRENKDYNEQISTKLDEIISAQTNK